MSANKDNVHIAISYGGYSLGIDTSCCNMKFAKNTIVFDNSMFIGQTTIFNIENEECITRIAMKDDSDQYNEIFYGTSTVTMSKKNNIGRFNDPMTISITLADEVIDSIYKVCKGCVYRLAKKLNKCEYTYTPLENK